jgi:hypothetical protein
MRERHPGDRVLPRLASPARRWRCRTRDVGECRNSVPAELMLRRATPTQWPRCLARPSDAPLGGAPAADEQAADLPPPPPEESAYWRVPDDDDD